MSQATITVEVDEPEQQALADAWLERGSDALSYESDHLGGGGCVDVWAVEGSPEAPGQPCAQRLSDPDGARGALDEATAFPPLEAPRRTLRSALAWRPRLGARAGRSGNALPGLPPYPPRRMPWAWLLAAAFVLVSAVVTLFIASAL